MAIDNVLEAFGSHIVGTGGGGGSGTGGHTIVDQDGNDMASEDDLQFADAFVSDDSTNGRTVIENIKEHTTASDYDNATEDGFHVIDDGNDVPIGDIEEDYVSVTADGDKTYQTLFNELAALVTWNRVIDGSHLEENVSGNKSVYTVGKRTASSASFFYGGSASSGARVTTYTVKSGNSSAEISTGTTYNDISSNKPTNGTVITLYYGSSKAIVNLLTNADSCMLDSNTSVKQAIVKKTDLTSIIATGSTNATGSTIASGTYFYLNGVLVRAKADIAAGATFTQNTNYEVVTAGALNELVDALEIKEITKSVSQSIPSLSSLGVEVSGIPSGYTLISGIWKRALGGGNAFIVTVYPYGNTIYATIFNCHSAELTFNGDIAVYLAKKSRIS